ncbi:conserved domain protein [Klebsiella sp. MS 92-3]|nr:conserved domain protein [Klebsiella sp. MS 92-3]
MRLVLVVGLPIMATTLRFVLQAASAPAMQRLPPGGNLNDFA